MKFDKNVIILGSLVVVSTVVFFYIVFLSTTTTPSPSPVNPIPTPLQINSEVPKSFAFSPFQKTKIGITSEEEVKKLSVVKVEKINADTTKYTVSSVDPLLFDEIIIHNNKVIYEKTSTLTQLTGGYPFISEFVEKFGDPEEEILGSTSHGQFATIYLYPKSGFVLIGNKQTDRVYEVQRFTPMTLDQYKTIYGSEIKTDWKHEE